MHACVVNWDIRQLLHLRTNLTSQNFKGRLLILTIICKNTHSKGPPGVLQSSPVHPSEHTHLMSSEQLPFLQGGLQTVCREVRMYIYSQ